MSVDTILARQAGVISRDQALAAGLSPDAIAHRIRTRQWRPLHPRVYLAAGHRLGDEAKVRSALLWAGPGAVLCGVAAAWWQGMAERPPSRVGITVPRHRRPRSHPGVTVRRRALAEPDLTVHRGLPVTARALTVLEASVELGPGGSLLLDRALQHRVHWSGRVGRSCAIPGTTCRTDRTGCSPRSATPSAPAWSPAAGSDVPEPGCRPE